MELYVFHGDHFSFNIKEQLFKNEIEIIFDLVVKSKLIIPTITTDLNFENEIIFYQDIDMNFRRNICNNLVNFYKRSIVLTLNLKKNPKNYLLNERILNIISSCSF